MDLGDFYLPDVWPFLQIGPGESAGEQRLKFPAKRKGIVAVAQHKEVPLGQSIIVAKYQRMLFRAGKIGDIENFGFGNFVQWSCHGVWMEWPSQIAVIRGAGVRSATAFCS